MTATYVPRGDDVTTFVDRGTVGPLAGIEYHVALGYYPETEPLAAWDTALWDAPTALWEGAAPLDDVSCDVVSVRIAEGRDLPLGRFRPAVCTVVLNDPDGNYSPWRNASTPTAFAAVRVGVDLVAWVDQGGTLFPRFRGIVESIADTFPDEGGQHRVMFHAVDYLGALGAFDGTEQPAVGAGELCGRRLTRIANNAGYSGPTAFDTGTIALQATTLSRNALDESGIAVDTELGAYWCDRDGVLVFRDQNGLVADPAYTTVQAVFGDGDPATELPYTDVELTSDTAEVRNVVSIANTGGTAVTRTDNTSIALYRPRTFQRFDLIHVDAAQSPIIAQRHLDVFAYAANRVHRVTVDLAALTPTDRAVVLGLDTLHRIELRRRAEGFQVVAQLQLQGMAEEIDADGWQVTFRTFAAADVIDIARWSPTGTTTADVSDSWNTGEWGY